MKLTELNPEWLTRGGKRIGIRFICPHCNDQRLVIGFDKALDGEGYTGIVINREGPIAWMMGGEGNNGWSVQGDTFETLTITPSIDVSQHGHWHGSITNGEMV